MACRDATLYLAGSSHFSGPSQCQEQSIIGNYLYISCINIITIIFTRLRILYYLSAPPNHPLWQFASGIDFNESILNDLSTLNAEQISQTIHEARSRGAKLLKQSRLTFGGTEMELGVVVLRSRHKDHERIWHYFPKKGKPVADGEDLQVLWEGKRIVRLERWKTRVRLRFQCKISLSDSC